MNRIVIYVIMLSIAAIANVTVYAMDHSRFAWANLILALVCTGYAIYLTFNRKSFQ